MESKAYKPMIMCELSRKMNSNFRVKVHGLGYHTLVGWSGLNEIVGPELAERAVCKAFESKQDKWTWKLRRGLKLDFYSK